MTKPDWDSLRKDFPAVNNHTYLITASVGPLHKKVHSAWSRHIDNLHFNGDIHWMDNLDSRDSCRKVTAELIEANPQDIAFSPNTSHNMNLLAMMLAQEKKGKIITIADEFPSTVLPWYHHGFEVIKVPSENGVIRIEDLAASTDENTSAVVVSAVQFSTGFRLNINELGTILKEKNIPFIVNATQALGAFPVSVKEANISALTASCHKWLGAGYSGSIFYTDENFRKKYTFPLTGWASVKEPFLMSNSPQDLSPDGAGFETGILPFSAIAAIKAAVEVIQETGQENISQRILYLSDYLFEKLQALELKIVTPRDKERDYLKSVNTGIISIAVDTPQEIEEKLSAANIYVSARRDLIRFSVHYYNNEKDIDTLTEELKNIFER